MSTERFEQLKAELHPFHNLWASAEFSVVAISDESRGKGGKELVSLATRLVLKPGPFSNRPPQVFDPSASDLMVPFLAIKVEYPIETAEEMLYRLVATGHFTAGRDSHQYPIRLAGALLPVAKEEPLSARWTPVRLKRRQETKAYGTDRPCIVLEDTIEASNSIAMLISQQSLEAVDSYLLQMRPIPTEGVRDLVSRFMPGIRFSMDTSPAVQVIAPLPFDLTFDSQNAVKLQAPGAAFESGVRLSIFFKPLGDPLAWDVSTKDSAETTSGGIREWHQGINWPNGAETAKVVLLYKQKQIDELTISRLSRPTIPDAVGAGRAVFMLSGAQRTLLEALSRKDNRLADLYVGSLRALSITDNPDRFGQACHSLRELMEKVPKWCAEVPAAEQLPRMGDKVRALATKWERARKETSCMKDAAWSGAIDGVMREVLGEIDAFFTWLRQDIPMRRERTAGMLRKMDPMGVPLPTQIEELRVQEWSLCRDYFVKVAHHNTEAAGEEVAKWVYVLESFLLDLLKPRTFEKHETIDSIVEQGERNAEP